MKYLILIVLILFSHQLLVSEMIHTPSVRNTNTDTTTDATSDQVLKDVDKWKFENPFKDVDFQWFDSRYRMEKVFIAVGISSSIVGFSLDMVGIFGLTLPQTDNSTIYQGLYIGLISAGGTMIVSGITLTIIGGVRISVLKSRDKLEVGFSFRL